jgi:Mrp family chromosome partitioning ATPase
MSALVDGVLLVARSGKTNRKALGSTIGTLNRLRANVLGIVMNEVRADTSDTYYYHYYHPKYYRDYNKGMK